jgi:hypothetical protein
VTGRTVEYGLRDPDGTTWSVPEYVAARGVDPLTWATRVAAAEGQTVVTRTVTVTEWVIPEKADQAQAFYAAHGSHDVGWRHEDGRLYSATCHDCGVRYEAPEKAEVPDGT